MNERLLRPHQTRRKIISLTRTDRWLSVIRHHSTHQQRITALDWSDLVTESRRWPGSAIVVEVDEVNLAAACRFSLDRPDLRARCGLFSVTDFSSPVAVNALAIAGYMWTCRSPLAAHRLFRQIERYHQENPANHSGIETEFRQRLPWERAGRYAGSRFEKTQFSVLPPELHANGAHELVNKSDPLGDTQERND